MALNINKTINGVTASYWDIVQLYFNVDEKYLEVEVRGYESRNKRNEAKTGTKTALITLRFSMSGPDFPDVTKANLDQKIFQYIKNSARYGGWSTATDV